MNITAAVSSARETRVEPTSRLGRLARRCYTARRRVLLVWVLALIVITGASQVWHGVFANKFNAGNSESARAQSLLNQRFPSRAGDQAEVVFHTADAVTSPAVKGRITATLSQLVGLRDVAGVRSPFDTGGSSDRP
ncbi:MAG TPA: hypothetical protein VKQ71_16240 [Acidimicrobiales bacterium]|nr:hypothetical protein [Acidimicrobiales bacterium]